MSTEFTGRKLNELKIVVLHGEFDVIASKSNVKTLRINIKMKKMKKILFQKQSIFTPI